jgi:hypothetical protein
MVGSFQQPAIDSNPAIADIENVEIVFKDGVGYDTRRFLDSVQGRYGEYQNGEHSARRFPQVALRIYLLKFTTALPQPTPCTQRVWSPGMSGAMSASETIICAVNDSSLPSPAR